MRLALPHSPLVSRARASECASSALACAIAGAQDRPAPELQPPLPLVTVVATAANRCLERNKTPSLAARRRVDVAAPHHVAPMGCAASLDASDSSHSRSRRRQRNAAAVHPLPLAQPVDACVQEQERSSEKKQQQHERDKALPALSVHPPRAHSCDNDFPTACDNKLLGARSTFRQQLASQLGLPSISSARPASGDATALPLTPATAAATRGGKAEEVGSPSPCVSDKQPVAKGANLSIDPSAAPHPPSSLYDSSNPDYRAYCNRWHAEQQRLMQEEREGHARIKGRSIYTSSDESVRSNSASPGPSGVTSPIAGGRLIAKETALCFLVESSRPESVCSSPLPRYKIAYDPSPLSPSPYVLGGDRPSVTPLALPASSNPLSPALSSRLDADSCLSPYTPNNGLAAPVFTFQPHSRHSRTPTTAGELLTQHRKAALHKAAGFEHKRTASNPTLPASLTDTARSPPIRLRPPPIIVEGNSFGTGDGGMQMQFSTLPLLLPHQPVVQGAAHAVDWQRVQAQLYRLAEEKELSESQQHADDRPLSPSSRNSALPQPSPPLLSQSSLAHYAQAAQL